MARSVRAGSHKKGVYMIYLMPQLVEGKTRYKSCVGKRLRAFKDPVKKMRSLEIPKNRKIEPFFHKPRYDAESVFWLPLYWAIQAEPTKSAGYPKAPIQRADWTALTEGDKERDPRGQQFVYATAFPSVLHPAYQELEELFALMAKHLRGSPSSTIMRVKRKTSAFTGFSSGLFLSS